MRAFQGNDGPLTVKVEVPRFLVTSIGVEVESVQHFRPSIVYTRRLNPHRMFSQHPESEEGEQMSMS